MAARKVLLVGWDAADWKVIHPLIREGKMPNLRRLIENGASGAVATLHPVLSPMLWTSIATGKRPFQHGILGFTEPTADGRGVQPISNRSRKCKALWNTLHQNDLHSIVVGWWPSHPAEPIRGVMVSDRYHRANAPLEEGWPLAEGAVSPRSLTPRLADLRVHPEHLTPAMVEPFIPRAHEIDQDQDKRLAALLRTLAECMTIQSAASWLIEHEPWDFFAVYFEALDHFCHGFTRYHPPRQPWIAERDFDLYHNVVAAAYQMLDEMLGALLKKAGDDVTVIVLSDHGFHPDHLRPMSIPDIPAGPAVEHRDFGIFAIRGPGVRRNMPVAGASILDVTPTILALYGLPVGEDMEGKVLSNAFLETPHVSFLPSWEEIPGDDGRHPPDTRVDAIAVQEMLEQMIALGYLERPEENSKTAAEKTVRELRYNLAQAYQDADRHPEALEVLTQLEKACPDEVRFTVRRFVSCQALGRHDEMRQIAAALERRFDSQPLAAYLNAQVCIAEHRYSEACAALSEIARDSAPSPDLLSQIGDLHVLQRDSHEARKAYKKALALDPDCAPAILGLTRLALRQRKFREATHQALDALSRAHQSPHAHFLLGCALAGMKKFEQAAAAFRTALSFNPNFPEAHRRLARLLRTHLGDPKSAAEHLRLLQVVKERRTLPKSEPSFKIESIRVPRLTSSVSAPDWSRPLVVVTGLPRSGTSMIMQMLDAGGIPVLSDHLREADEDNPRGYFEFEPVKRLLTDSCWLSAARGKAVKIIVPLLSALPAAIPSQVIFCERDLDEILDSQECMLRRKGSLLGSTRRQMLEEEYTRSLKRSKAFLRNRSATTVVTIDYNAAVSNPLLTAQKIQDFLGVTVAVDRMAGIIDPALHRNHAR